MLTTAPWAFRRADSYVQRLCSRRLAANSHEDFQRTIAIVSMEVEVQLLQSLMRRRIELARDVYLAVRRRPDVSLVDEEAIRDVLRFLTSRARLGALAGISPVSGYLEEFLVHPTRMKHVTEIRERSAESLRKHYILKAGDFAALTAFELSKRDAVAIQCHLAALGVGAMEADGFVSRG